MALRIRFDDRLDRLADALIEELSVASGDPLAEDSVIVPGVGVGRWLQQRIADRSGVSARLSLEFPGRFIWRSLRALLPELPAHSPFEPRVARWTILRLFDELPEGDECAPLAQRVSGASPADRLTLADEIAAQFERYLAWRRDWLARWQAGRWAQDDAPLDRHERWQRWLWRRLLERLPRVSQAHPFDLLEGILRDEPQRAREALGGRRVWVLGMTALSPEQTTLLARLSSVIDVSIHAPDPCRELWSDLVDRKTLARIVAQRPDVAWLYESEPEVLGNWGRAQRDFVAQLLALEEAAGIQAQAPLRERPHPLDPLLEAQPQALATVAAAMPALTRLQALQSAVLLRSDRPWRLARADGDDPSIQLHATHGLVREAEVLHDRLLDCFATMPQLRPDQVAVFCTSIEEAADAIESVFAGVPPQRRIPVAVSGRAARADPLLRAALELLQLAEQQAPISRVAQWLANPAALEALGLDDEEAAALVRAFDAAGARWGLDAQGGPPRHHWRAALERLLVGAAVGALDDADAGAVPGGFAAVGDVAVIPGLRSVGTRALERLMPLFDALDELRAFAREPAEPARWCTLAGRVLGRMFARARSHADALSQLMSAIAGLRESAEAAPGALVDAAGLRQALAGELDRAASAALPSGAVAVCPIGGLRGLPYRVVCLFGMDEGAFPRAGVRSEFDLMRRAPRFGDREQRFDDRGVFLDALLAAGERLIVLYHGRDARDNSARNPSTLVAELVEYANARRPEGAQEIEERKHRLHGFSPHAFARDGDDAGRERASFAQERLATAQALALPLSQRDEGVGAIVEAGVAPEYGVPGRGEPTLDAMRDALVDPARAYLRSRVGLRLVREDPPVEEIEPLWGDDERDRELVGRLAQGLLAGASGPALLDVLLASPRIAAGAAGRAQASALLEAAQRLVGRCEQLGAATPGQSRCLVSSFNLGMHALVDAWLSHAHWLVAQAAPATAQQGQTPVTYLVTPDRTVSVSIADPAAALEHARTWAARARSEALALFPRTLRAWHDAGDAEDARREAARRELFGDDGGRRLAEIERPWFAALHRDAQPELDSVIELGEKVYGPILADCSVDKVASG